MKDPISEAQVSASVDAGLHRLEASRITSLDFLRGVAILGMLVANVPWLAGDSMSRVREADVANVSAWLAQYLIFDQRFLPIFCMLFGAGVYLLSAGCKDDTAFNRYFMRRMAILLAIGVAHAYILWPGDILITYAVCGPLLLLFRSQSAWRLIAVGAILKGVDLMFGEWPSLYEMSIERVLFSWWVDYGVAPSTIVEAYSGSYRDLFEFNAWRNQFIQWTALPHFRIWNALGFMLIGMGLFKLGVLQGQRSVRFYRKLLWISLAIGAPLIAYGVLARIGINPTVGPFLGFTTELPLRSITFLSGCAIVSLGVVGGVHILYPTLSKAATEPLEAVGRMALTNYIFHSVFFFVLFFSLKLIEYDSLDHDGLLLLVLLVWTVQLFLSTVWMRHFKQGPIEALWRRMAGRKP